MASERVTVAQRPRPSLLTMTTPANGGEIAVNGTLILNFDTPPETVTVNGTPTTLMGATATWNAVGLTSNQLTNILIEWGNPDATLDSATITLSVPTRRSKKTQSK